MSVNVFLNFKFFLIASFSNNLIFFTQILYSIFVILSLVNYFFVNGQYFFACLVEDVDGNHYVERIIDSSFDILFFFMLNA